MLAKVLKALWLVTSCISKQDLAIVRAGHSPPGSNHLPVPACSRPQPPSPPVEPFSYLPIVPCPPAGAFHAGDIASQGREKDAGWHSVKELIEK